MSQVETPPPVKQKWSAIVSQKGEIASQLEQAFRLYPSISSRRILSLAAWFRGDARYEDALVKPDVLAIVLQLLPHLTADEPIGSAAELSSGNPLGITDDSLPTTTFLEKDQPLVQTEPRDRSQLIGDAVRKGCNEIAALPTSTGLRAWSLLCYPLLLGFVVWVIWIIVSQTLVPQLQEVVEQYPVTPSLLTAALFKVSGLISDYGYLLIPLPLLVLAGLAYLILFGGRSSSVIGLGPIHFFQGRRNKLAWWLWHLSLLLQLRIEHSTALLIAGYSTRWPWLQNRSLQWGEDKNIPLLPTRLSEFDSDDPPPLPPTRFFGKAKYQLVDYAISLPPSEDKIAYKIALLREIANYYWERDRITTDWWIFWWASMLKLAIVLMVLLILIGLFGLMSQLLFPF